MRGYDILSFNAKQKQEISKIRRLTEKQFKKAKLTSRKYSSTLTSLEKRVNSSRIQIEDFSQTLNQKIAQLESVQRLKKSAQERLDFETQNKEQLESEIDFSNTEEEKQGTLSRIRIIMGVIDETKNEIKNLPKNRGRPKKKKKPSGRKFNL